MPKKIVKAILLPPNAVAVLLLPLSAVFLVYAMLTFETTSPICITSYLLAFYTLTVWCIKIPTLWQQIKSIKSKNKYLKRWTNDVRFRINISLTFSLLLNTAYAAFQLGLGIVHGSFWFYSLAGYYASLAFMRLFLIRHSAKHKPGEKMRKELKRYRLCGIVFLFINLILSVMILFMIRQNRLTVHHPVTTIAMATYTFTAFTLAIINVIKYRKYNSPIFSASKAISLAAACVSMLTLESTMLVTFNSGNMSHSTIQIFLGISGSMISAFIIAMALYMIIQSNKKIKKLYPEGENNMNKNTDDTFHYTYSAEQQEEIQSIRNKYIPKPTEENKMEQLRRLDASVTQKATTVSIAVGLIGTLVMGLGMSLVMSELAELFGAYRKLALPIGIVLGVIGIGLVCCAYPLYNRTIKKEREKIAADIIRLTDELMK